MKRKKEFNFKEFILSALSKVSRTQWYYIATLFLFYFIDVFLLNCRLIDTIGSTTSVRELNNNFGLIFGIAILLISYLSSKFDFKWFFLLKCIVGYFIYTSLSYLVDVTTNINNPKFKLWNFKNNPFLQTNGLWTLFSIILISSLCFIFRKYYENKTHRGRVTVAINKEFEYLLLGQFLTLLIFSDSKIPSFISKTTTFIKIGEKYNLGKYSEAQFWSLFPTTFGLFILLSFVTFLFMKGQSDFIKNKPSFSLSVFFSAVFAIVFNFTLQIGMGNSEKFLGYSFLPGALLFQFITLFLLFISVFLVTNKVVLSTLIILSFGTVFSIANAIKFSMRNEPVLPSDLSWLSSVDQLFGFVDLSIVLYSILCLVLLPLLYIILRKLFFQGRILRSFLFRILLLLTIIIVYVNVFDLLSNKEQNGQVRDGVPIVSQLNNFQNIVWMGNTVNARYKSISYVWFNQMATEVVPIPEGYSKARINKIKEKYASIASELNKTRNSNIQDNTIIYILSESFSDPSRIDTVKLNKDVIPNIRSIKNNTTSGLMQSDGYGGGTANMEFQTLFGLPYYNMSQSVAVLYTEVFPKLIQKPSISNSFNEKDRIAIHFNDPRNYSRNVVYKNLKFNKFITSPAKGVEHEKQGAYLSDRTLYNTILRNLSTNKNENQFFSIITMQNHAPWSESSPEDLTAIGEKFSDEENAKLLNYSRLLTHTDSDTQSFLESLSKIDKKITVVFYGDHLPGLYPESAFKNNPESQYQTDYFIWSNFDAPKLNYPLVNSSDFSAMVFEQTNSKVSPYYALLTEVLKKASVDKKALEGEAQEIAEDLKMVEYDLISGKGYLSKDFFKVPTNKSN